MKDESLLIRGGRLLSPADGFHGIPKDILIRNGKISAIEDRIPEEVGVKVLDAAGSYVSPGFIDIHTHVFDTAGLLGGRALGLPADMIGVEQGTTTVVDAGTAGPATMDLFVKETIQKSRTRVYSAMHYATDGLKDPPEADDPNKYDLETGKAAFQKYAPYIAAIKARASATCVGQLGITSIRAGKALARAIGKPMLVHIGHMPPEIEDVLDTLDKGDIITHAFHGKDNNLLASGEIKPQTQAARDRGVLFDIGHGKDSFNFETGRRAKALGFYPDSISTDLHVNSYHKPVQSLSETASKFLALGYDLEWAIDRITAAPARELSLEGLGHLEAGALGDVTVFHVAEGDFTFIDANKNVLKGERMITPDYAVIGGRVELDTTDTFHDLCRTAGVDPNYIPDYAYIAKGMLKTLKEKQIALGTDRELALLNHCIALLSRLRAGEHVPPMGPEILEELDDSALSITDELLEPVNRWFGQADDAERVLLALHIQSAMEG